jgi:Domain of unknown function (DUF6933)
VYTVRGTRPFLKRIGARATEGRQVPSTALGDWYCKHVRAGSQQLVLFTSDRTLLCVVVPARGLKKVINESLSEGLAAVLRRLSITPAAIAREQDEMREFDVAGTVNRSVLGSLNDFAVAIKFRLEGREKLSLVALALELARTPCKPLEYAFPAEVAARALESSNYEPSNKGMKLTKRG